MLRSLVAVFTSRAAGPVASLVAAVLALTLAVAWNGWNTERAGYERKLAEATRQAERSQALLKADLAACHAEGGGPRRVTEAAYGPGGGAEQLLEQGPAGIDACARMESADQAVLQNLK